MPRKKQDPQLKVLESPTTLVPASTLTLEERVALRDLFNNPVFIKAWNNASACKPSPFRRDGLFDGALGNQLATNRLHQLQGWEMFVAALLTQVNDPKPPRQEIPYTYSTQE